MERVKNYLKNIEFKKCDFGGIEEESAMKAIKELERLHGEIQKEDQEAFRKQKEHYDALKEEHRKSLAEIFELRTELREKAAAGDKMKEEYEKKIDEFSEFVSEIKGMKEDLFVKAREKAEKKAALFQNERMKQIEAEYMRSQNKIKELNQEISNLQFKKQEIGKQIDNEKKNLGVYMRSVQKELQESLERYKRVNTDKEREKQ